MTETEVKKKRYSKYSKYSKYSAFVIPYTSSYTATCSKAFEEAGVLPTHGDMGYSVSVKVKFTESYPTPQIIKCFLQCNTVNKRCVCFAEDAITQNTIHVANYDDKKKEKFSPIPGDENVSIKKYDDIAL
jgi:hypothetical protein